VGVGVGGPNVLIDFLDQFFGICRPATTAIPLENLIPIEELAKRLHQTESWVREKCRRLCSNPIPVYNLGRHLLFDGVQISEWIRNTTRPIHVRHRCRKRYILEEGGIN
jgi:hypothetical protein